MDPHEHEPSYYEVALTNRQVVIGFVALLACVFTAFLAGVWLGRDAAPTAAAQIADNGSADPAALDAEARGGGKRIPKLTFFGETAEPGTGAGESRPGAAASRKRAGENRRNGAPDGSAPAAGAPRGVEETTKAEPPTGADESSGTGADPASESMRRTLEAEMEAHRDPADDAAAGDAASGSRSTTDAEVPLQPGERIQRGSTATSPAPAASSPVAAPRAAAPVPAAAPPVVSPSASPATKSPAAPAPFWIQVYSSSNGVRAREIATGLTRSGFGVRVLEVGTTFRVRVGPYANRDLADASARRLRREQKLDTWVTDQP